MSPPRKVRRSAGNVTPVPPESPANTSRHSVQSNALNTSVEPQPSTSAASPVPSTSAMALANMPPPPAPSQPEPPTTSTNNDEDADDVVDPMSQFEDEEGGFTVGDIYIPPPVKPYCSSESRGARLIITKIMNTNFKSYAQDVALGPFCHVSFNHFCLFFSSIEFLLLLHFPFFVCLFCSDFMLSSDQMAVVNQMLLILCCLCSVIVRIKFDQKNWR